MFRSSRPDYIETQTIAVLWWEKKVLFRSSRPDYIETTRFGRFISGSDYDCSGLPDRTTLRQRWRSGATDTSIHCSGLPDRTTLRPFVIVYVHDNSLHNCSGLPDRTTLRPPLEVYCHIGGHVYCSGLPDRTTLRQVAALGSQADVGYCSGLPDRTTLRRIPIYIRDFDPLLFRSSRPDYIETHLPIR